MSAGIQDEAREAGNALLCPTLLKRVHEWSAGRRLGLAKKLEKWARELRASAAVMEPARLNAINLTNPELEERAGFEFEPLTHLEGPEHARRTARVFERWAKICDAFADLNESKPAPESRN